MDNLENIIKDSNNKEVKSSLKKRVSSNRKKSTRFSFTKKINNFQKLLNVFISKKGAIFLIIIIGLSLIEVFFKVETTALKIIKSILQVILFLE